MDISDILAQLKKEFIESFPEKIILIENLIKQKDYKSLELEFHKFKGIGSTYAFPEITEMGKHVEQLIKNKSANADKAALESLKILILISNEDYSLIQNDLKIILETVKSFH